MGHCQMDTIAEELSGLGGYNLLVIGMTECAFYSHKIPFVDGLNLSYTLTDKELVLQDLEGLETVFSELAAEERKTVVLETCIPCLMNLDIESLTDSDRFIFLKVPNYVGMNSLDILSLLYLKLFKNELQLCPTSGTIEIDSASFLKTIKSKKALACKNYLIKEKKYYRLFKEKGSQYEDVRILDESRIHDFSYYEENREALGLATADIVDLKHMIGGFNRRTVSIKSVHAVEFALFLKDFDIQVDKIVVPFIDDDRFKTLTTRLKTSSLSLDYSTAFRDVIDLSMLDNTNKTTSFETLKRLIKEIKHAIE